MKLKLRSPEIHPSNLKLRMLQELRPGPVAKLANLFCKVCRYQSSGTSFMLEIVTITSNAVQVTTHFSAEPILHYLLQGPWPRDPFRCLDRVVLLDCFHIQRPGT